jgi:hypothetical protein
MTIRNRSIVITGAMPTGTRDEWADKLAKVGCALMPRVTASTDVLVVADASKGETTKTRDARAKGVMVRDAAWLVGEYLIELGKVNAITGAYTPKEVAFSPSEYRKPEPVTDLTEVLRDANESFLSPEERENEAQRAQRAQAEGRLAAMKLATKASESMPTDESVFEV